MLAVDSIAEMHKLAAKIAAQCQGGELIGLSGELGAGKTEFAKGFLASFNYAELVTSPSYTIENIYELPVASQSASRGAFSEIHHFDCYRLAGSSNLEQFREATLRDDIVCLIEWPEKIEDLEDLLSLRLHIKFSPSNEEQRLVELDGELINL